MSDLSAQPVPAWPANHRAALSVILHVDAPARSADDWGIGADYTADGLTRLLALFDDLDVAVTVAWTDAALARFPQLARGAQDRGHELALSFAGHGDGAGGGEPIAARVSDLPIVGLVEALPGDAFDDASRSTPTTLASPRWIVDGSGNDVPRLHSATADQPPTVVIPVSPFWVDRHWWSPDRPSAPSLLLESWSAGLASIRTLGGLMTVVLHPHLSGRPGHAETIVRFVDEGIASGDVWLARADQVAAWWTQSHAH